MYKWHWGCSRRGLAGYQMPPTPSGAMRPLDTAMLGLAAPIRQLTIGFHAFAAQRPPLVLLWEGRWGWARCAALAVAGGDLSGW